MFDGYHEDHRIYQPEVCGSVYSAFLHPDGRNEVSWGLADEIPAQELVELHAVQQPSLSGFDSGLRQLCAWIGATSISMAPRPDDWFYSAAVQLSSGRGEAIRRSEDITLYERWTLVPRVS